MTTHAHRAPTLNLSRTIPLLPVLCHKRHNFIYTNMLWVRARLSISTVRHSSHGKTVTAWNWPLIYLYTVRSVRMRGTFLPLPSMNLSQVDTLPPPFWISHYEDISYETDHLLWKFFLKKRTIKILHKSHRMYFTRMFIIKRSPQSYLFFRFS